jgi:integrase
LVTGLRRGELLALKWSDIDFNTKRITIDKSNSTTGLGDTKSSKAHFVPLSDKAILFLEEQKKQLKKENNPILLRDDLKKSDLVFPSDEGVMIRPDSYFTMLSRYAQKAGIKASPHCLRHSFVFYTRGKLSLKDLQNTLGHDESTTTLDIYGDILNDSAFEAAEQIDNAFDALEKEVEKINDKKHKKEGNLIQVDFGKAK